MFAKVTCESAVLQLQDLSWNSSNCSFISMCPVILTVDLLNHSIRIIFCLTATAQKRRVILYSGTWRSKSLLQLEVLGFLTQPSAQQNKAQVQRHFDIWVHVASLVNQRWVVKYSDSQSRNSRVGRVFLHNADVVFYKNSHLDPACFLLKLRDLNKVPDNQIQWNRGVILFYEDCGFRFIFQYLRIAQISITRGWICR